VKATGASPLIALAVMAALFSAGCAKQRIASPAPARVQVVLLADPESAAASAATVTNPSGRVTLDEPRESTSVTTDRSPSPPVKMDEGEVQRQFADVLSNLPPGPQHFILYFKTDSAELADQSRGVVPDVLRAAAARQVPEVTVIGHTDSSGSRRNNYRLGLERARSVRELLLKAGLEPALIEVESHGEADPLRKTPDNTREPRNRRVEITIR